jgi:hypothetical protein
MTDKILTWIVVLLSGMIATDFLIPGPVRRTIITTMRVETGVTLSKYSLRNLKENVAYFDTHRARISESDVTLFSEGDSIEYRLTPIVRSLKTIKNLKSGYRIYVHFYFISLLLTAIIIVAQVLNVNIKWNKTNKELIQIIIFSLLIVVGYILIFI